MSVKLHKLKSWPDQFQAVWDGIKVHEYRKDDRDFHIGDILILKEYNPNKKRGKYSGRHIIARVMYVSRRSFGIPNEYCVMSIYVTQKLDNNKWHVVESQYEAVDADSLEEIKADTGEAPA